MTDDVQTDDATTEETPSTEVEESSETESPSEPAQAAAEETPSEEKAEGGDEDEPEAWKNLVKKHDGDKAKIGDAYWRANNEAARLARENKDLRQAIERGKAAAGVAPQPSKPEPPTEKPYEEHPSAQKLESEITALEATLATMAEAGKTQLGKIEAQREALAVKRHALKAAGDLATDDQRDALALAEERFESLVEAFNEKRERFNEKKQLLQDKQGRREAVRGEIDAERARQKQVAEDNAKFNEEYPKIIDAQIAAVAQDMGVTADDAAVGGHVWEVVNEHLTVLMFRLGQAGQKLGDVDTEGIIRAKIERIQKATSEARKAAFTKTSREKAETSSARHKVTPGKPLIPPKPPARLPLLHVGGSEDPKLQAARERLAAKGM